MKHDFVSALRGLLGEDDELPYECRGCGEGFSLQHYSCPECGSYRVERTTWFSE